MGKKARLAEVGLKERDAKKKFDDPAKYTTDAGNKEFGPGGVRGLVKDEKTFEANPKVKRRGKA